MSELAGSARSRRRSPSSARRDAGARRERSGSGELLAAHRALAAVDPRIRARRDWRCGPRSARGTSDLGRVRRRLRGLLRLASRPQRAAASTRSRPRSCRASRSRTPCRAPLDLADRGARGRAGRVVGGRAAARTRTSPSTPTPSAPRRARDPDSRGAAAARPRLRRAAPAARAGAATRPRSARDPARRRSATRGEPLERRWREPSPRPRRLVLVCDVSGSMEPYARMLLAYAHACVAGARRCEAFAFGTRLTRITRELRGPRPRRRRCAAPPSRPATGRADADRRGARRAQPRARPPRSAAARSSSILSDGWDRGDPSELAPRSQRSRAAPTSSSGSTRSRRRPSTSR